MVRNLGWCHLLLVLSIISTPALATTIDLRASEDTYVATGGSAGGSADPARNYGTRTSLYFGAELSTYYYRTLIKFDLSQLPSNAIISSAVLNLRKAGSLNAPSNADVWIPCANWSELTATWNNKPNACALYASLPNLFGTGEFWRAVDITSLATDWLAGVRPNYGVYLIGSDLNKWAAVTSREWSGLDFRTYLRIQYEIPVPPAPQWTHGFTSDSNGDYSVSWTAVAGATYTLEEYRDAALTQLNLSVTQPAISYALQDRINGTYYYRVKAIVNGVDGPYSTTTPVAVSYVPLVLVHGFQTSDNPNPWAGTVSLLESQGYVVDRIDYYVDQAMWNTTYRIEGIGIYVGQQIGAITTRHNCSQVDILAHSMGGLAVRCYIAEMGPVNPSNTNLRIPFLAYGGNVRKLITLGTPHYGSFLTNWADVWPLNRTDLVSERDALIQEMSYGSRFMFDLREYSQAHAANFAGIQKLAIVGERPGAMSVSDGVVFGVSAAWLDLADAARIVEIPSSLINPLEPHVIMDKITSTSSSLYHVVNGYIQGTSEWQNATWSSPYSQNVPWILGRAKSSLDGSVLLASSFEVDTNLPFPSPNVRGLSLNENANPRDGYYPIYFSAWFDNAMFAEGLSDYSVVASGYYSGLGQKYLSPGFTNVIDVQLDPSTDVILPTVAVTSPNGGESWAMGSVHNITWTATDNIAVASITLEYSTNNGGAYTTIATGEANDGTYAWTVPNVASTQVLVRVKALDAVPNTGSDVSNAVFTIADQGVPSVTVNAPNGGEVWAAGSVHNITWTATDNIAVASITLEYSTNNGGAYTTIATGEANDGSYSWTLPQVVSTQVLVRVKALDAVPNTGSDVSNAVFTIADQAVPSVTVTAPNGAENWTAGGAHAITWTATDNIGVTAVDIAYSTNSGGSWTNVALGEANDGSYDWVVPNTLSVTSLVRVTAKDAALNSALDTSNAVFTISAQSAVEYLPAVLTRPMVLQNSPNPFNPTTRIGFGLPEAGHARLMIFSAGGRLVRTLADGEFPQGYSEVTWDGRDEGGAGMASGIYFYRFESGCVVETRRLVMSK